MASTLTELALQRTELEQQFLSRKSVLWFQQQTSRLNNPTRLANEIAAERARYGGEFKMGGLYHFYYDPTTKEKLPYWDIFPLVIPLSDTEDGFIGLNMHYLPVRYRAAFMDKLMAFAITNSDKQPERLRVTYNILKMSKNMREMRACIKRYKFRGIKTKILTIMPSEWETALFLPTAIFNAPMSQVYSDSINKANRV
jgi:hypothetical protein